MASLDLSVCRNLGVYCTLPEGAVRSGQGNAIPQPKSQRSAVQRVAARCIIDTVRGGVHPEPDRLRVGWVGSGEARARSEVGRGEHKVQYLTLESTSVYVYLRDLCLALPKSEESSSELLKVFPDASSNVLYLSHTFVDTLSLHGALYNKR